MRSDQFGSKAIKVHTELNSPQPSAGGGEPTLTTELNSWMSQFWVTFQMYHTSVVHCNRIEPYKVTNEIYAKYQSPGIKWSLVGEVIWAKCEK